MKKILLLFVMLILMSGVEGLNFGINLVEYNEETQYSRIHVSNELDRDLTGVTIQLGESRAVPIASSLKSGKIVYAIMSVPPGKYEIMVNSKEGITESKELSFSFSEEAFLEEQKRRQEVIQREKDLEELAKKNLEVTQKGLEDDIERAKELGVIKEKSNVMPILIGVGIVFIIGIIIYWLTQKKQ